MDGLREQRSTRLRKTEEIAKICDFDYNTRKLKYGGFFSVYQCDKIVSTIEKLQARIKELETEKAIIERERGQA